MDTTRQMGFRTEKFCILQAVIITMYMQLHIEF